MMGVDNFGITNMVLYVDGKPVGTIEQSKALPTLTTVDDEQEQDSSFFGIKYSNSFCDRIGKKQLLELFFGPCKSGRWRLKKRAIDRILDANMRKDREYEERFGLGPWPKDMRDEQ